MEIWRLFAHQHWLTLRIFSLKLRLCARCSGYISGFLFLATLGYFYDIPFFKLLSVQYQLLLCIFLIMPVIYDVSTQSIGLRESNNILRFITGVILGIGVQLYLSINIIYNLKISFFLSIAFIIAIVSVFFLNKHSILK